MTKQGHLKVRNYDRFQTYKRTAGPPPWVKVYRDLLLSHPFACLPDTSKQLFFGLLLVAAEYDNAIPNSVEFIVKRTAFSREVVEDGLSGLLDAGLVSLCKKRGRKRVAVKPSASGVQPVHKLSTDGAQVVPLEERRGETEADKKQKQTQTRKAALSVLSFLNAKTGKSFEPVESNLSLITSRLREAAEQYPNPKRLAALVIISKVNESKDKGSPFHDGKYLRPATLFGATKFWQYVGDLPRETKERSDDLPAMQ